jgi:hypothetical protein
MSSKEAYNVWMYSPIECDDEVEPVVKKMRKKKEEKTVEVVTEKAPRKPRKKNGNTV